MSGFSGLNPLDLVTVFLRPAPLVIGGFVLEGHEVPQKISVGGTQAVTIHKCPGGSRIIDAMGPDSGTIAWHGLFIGPSAAQRARSMDLMRQQGDAVPMAFGDYTLTVVIIRFQYDYRDQGAVIAYRLQAEIVPDPGAAAGTESSLSFVLQDDLNNAVAVLADCAASAAAYASLAPAGHGSSLAVALSTMPILAAGLGSASTQLASSATLPPSGTAALQARLTASAWTASGLINQVSTGGLANPASGFGFPSSAAFAGCVAQAGALAGLVRCAGYMNRANANLAGQTAAVPAPLISS